MTWGCMSFMFTCCTDWWWLTYSYTISSWRLSKRHTYALRLPAVSLPHVPVEVIGVYDCCCPHRCCQVCSDSPEPPQYDITTMQWCCYLWCANIYSSWLTGKSLPSVEPFQNLVAFSVCSPDISVIKTSETHLSFLDIWPETVCINITKRKQAEYSMYTAVCKIFEHNSLHILNIEH